MDPRQLQQYIERDRQHVWHPYAPMHGNYAPHLVESANGVRLKLADGREVIDGMSSWWCAIHGYNHPVLNEAISTQLQSMSHVMFGGLTHQPAIDLVNELVELSPKGLESVFLADSGSVSVEVAIKMAFQYWQSKGETQRTRLATLRNGYHGDTFGAMSVCDPVNGMHHLFADLLPQHVFLPAPTCRRDEDFSEADIAELRVALESRNDLAAVILEPLVQGAGGMRFYCAEYLRQVRRLCDEHDVLLIADEIATGFGRTGEWFACDHAGITPDILCVGKALTGGYMTMAATLATREISETLSTQGAGALMHGPTFMGNPLAASVSLASLSLLRTEEWRQQVAILESELRSGLAACETLDTVSDVRVFGAIGVVELVDSLNVPATQNALLERGVWLRPFGKLLYAMPQYVMSRTDVQQLTSAMSEVLSEQAARR